MNFFWSELERAYRSGKLVLFVGAGVSMPAGLPSWRQLIVALRAEVERQSASTPDIQEIDRLVSVEKYIEALSLCRRKLGDAHFFRFAESKLDDAPLAVPDVAIAVSEIAQGLRCIITTNVDRLLARALRGEWPEISRLTADLAQRDKYILKVHGTLHDYESWVFCRDDYDRVMYASGLTADYLGSIFRTASVLFVGFGHADENIGGVFSKIRALAGSQAPVHFALMRDDVHLSLRQTLNHSGVQLLEYKEHVEVPGLLRRLLSGRSGQSSSATTAMPPSIPSSGLSNEERIAAADAFATLTKVIELVDRWKWPSGVSSEEFNLRLAELWPAFVDAFRNVSLRLPSEFEWLVDGVIYLISQLRASDSSHKMFLGSGGGYARQIEEEFNSARIAVPRQINALWASFREELKSRANGNDARVSTEKLDVALNEILASIVRVPNGAVEFNNNESLRATAVRGERSGRLSLVQFGGKLVLRSPSLSAALRPSERAR